LLRNMMLVARNKLRVARSLLRATSCAGVKAALQLQLQLQLQLADFVM